MDTTRFQFTRGCSSTYNGSIRAIHKGGVEFTVLFPGSGRHNFTVPRTAQYNNRGVQFIGRSGHVILMGGLAFRQGVEFFGGMAVPLLLALLARHVGSCSAIASLTELQNLSASWFFDLTVSVTGDYDNAASAGKLVDIKRTKHRGAAST